MKTNYIKYEPGILQQEYWTIWKEDSFLCKKRGVWLWSITQRDIKWMKLYHTETNANKEAKNYKGTVVKKLLVKIHKKEKNEENK